MTTLSPAAFAEAAGITFLPYSSSVEQEVCQAVNKGYNLCASGSRVTTHFSETSDYDYVVFDWDGNFYGNVLNVKEWEEGGSGNLFSDFKSFKKYTSNGTINFIVVKDKEYYRKYVLATELIKKIDPKDKKGRIELFNMVFNQSQKEVPF